MGWTRNRQPPARLALVLGLFAGACDDSRCGGEPAPVAIEAAARARAPASSPVMGNSEAAAPVAPAEAPANVPPAASDSFWHLDAAQEVRVLRAFDVAQSGDLAELIRLALEDPSPAVREAAVVGLGDNGEGRAIDALIAASEDAERRVALAAIAQLALVDDRQAREALARRAGSQDPAIASAARDALQQ
jgi:HEAT repeat protein